MKRFFLCLLIVLLTSTALTVQADSLGDVVVTATRIEEPRKDVSSPVQVITSEDIKNSTAQDAADLVSEAGIGHVHKYPGTLSARIGLRGLATDLFSIYKSRVLVLIDGHNAGTVNLAKIPVEEIERIEIVKGPASVLYGSQAMGGVINIITKKAKHTGAELGTEGGSWDYSKQWAGLSLKEGVVDFLFSVSRASRGNYDARGYGKIPNTAYNDETFSLRLGYGLKEGGRLSFGLEHWRGWDIGSPGARYSPDPDDYSDKKRDGIDIAYSTETTRISYYRIEDKDEWYSNTNVTTKNTQTTGFTAQRSFEFEDVRLVAGVDWNRIRVSSKRTAGAPYSPNSRYNTYGVFTELRGELLNKRLILNGGLRYDYFKNEVLSTPGVSVTPRDEDLDYTALRGGAIYRLTGHTRVKLNAGTAFRAPAPDELATDYVSSWGTHYVGNPELEPEESVTYDAGVEFSDGMNRAELTFFHTEFDNKILGYYDASLSARTWKNVDGATVQGVETNLSTDIGALLGWFTSVEPFVNITYHTRYSAKDRTEIDKYGKTLLYTPKWVGSFGVRMMGESWDARLVARYNGKEKVTDWNRSSPTYGKTIEKTGFLLVNLKGSYRVHKKVELGFSVENLLNRSYEYVLGYPMPERTYTGIVRLII